MTNREWLPYDYFDEWVPPLRDSASAWIVPGSEGAATLATFDGDPGRVLADGELVPFLYHQEHGSAVLTIADDLTWSMSSPMPAEANSVWSPDLDCGGSCNIDILIEEMKDNNCLEPGTLDLNFCYWSDQLPFRFDAATVTFVQVQS